MGEKTSEEVCGDTPTHAYAHSESGGTERNGKKEGPADTIWHYPRKAALKWDEHIKWEKEEHIKWRRLNLNARPLEPGFGSVQTVHMRVKSISHPANAHLSKSRAATAGAQTSVAPVRSFGLPGIT